MRGWPGVGTVRADLGAEFDMPQASSDQTRVAFRVKHRITAEAASGRIYIAQSCCTASAHRAICALSIRAVLSFRFAHGIQASKFCSSATLMGADSRLQKGVCERVSQ